MGIFNQSVTVTICGDFACTRAVWPLGGAFCTPLTKQWPSLCALRSMGCAGCSWSLQQAFLLQCYLSPAPAVHVWGYIACVSACVRVQCMCKCMCRSTCRESSKDVDERWNYERWRTLGSYTLSSTGTMSGMVTWSWFIMCQRLCCVICDCVMLLHTCYLLHVTC